jgi:hypothetical protein
MFSIRERSDQSQLSCREYLGAFLSCCSVMDLVTAKRGIIRENGPRKRIVVFTNTQEAAKAHNGICDLAAEFSIMTRSIWPTLSPLERYTGVPSTLSLPMRFEVSRFSSGFA